MPLARKNIEKKVTRAIFRQVPKDYITRLFVPIVPKLKVDDRSNKRYK